MGVEYPEIVYIFHEYCALCSDWHIHPDSFPTKITPWIPGGVQAGRDEMPNCGKHIGQYAEMWIGHGLTLSFAYPFDSATLQICVCKL